MDRIKQIQAEMAEVHVPVTDDLVASAAKWLQHKGKTVNRANIASLLRLWAHEGMKSWAAAAEKIVNESAG